MNNLQCMSHAIAFGMWLRDNCHIEKPDTWCYKWSEYTTLQMYHKFVTEFDEFKENIKTQ